MAVLAFLNTRSQCSPLQRPSRFAAPIILATAVLLSGGFARESVAQVYNVDTVVGVGTDRSIGRSNRPTHSEMAPRLVFKTFLLHRSNSMIPCQTLPSA